MRQRRNKNYPIDRSPLFRLRNKRKFAMLLKLPLKKIRSLCSDDNYYEYPEEKNGNVRLIQAPKANLKNIQKNFTNILSRIETPEWIVSGKKGMSYIDNAK